MIDHAVSNKSHLSIGACKKSDSAGAAGEGDRVSCTYACNGSLLILSRLIPGRVCCVPITIVDGRREPRAPERREYEEESRAGLRTIPRAKKCRREIQTHGEIRHLMPSPHSLRERRARKKKFGGRLSIWYTTIEIYIIVFNLSACNRFFAAFLTCVNCEDT